MTKGRKLQISVIAFQEKVKCGCAWYSFQNEFVVFPGWSSGLINGLGPTSFKLMTMIQILLSMQTLG
jgi:hypothetical protein